MARELPAANTTYKVQCQHCSRMTHVGGFLSDDLKALHEAIAALERENALLRAGAPVPLPAPTTISAGTD